MTGRPSNPSLGKSDPDKVRETLERNCATEAEIEFLLSDDDHGPQRVELNALVSSRRFIDFIERKLAEHGISKVIPEAAALADAFRSFSIEIIERRTRFATRECRSRRKDRASWHERRASGRSQHIAANSARTAEPPRTPPKPKSG